MFNPVIIVAIIVQALVSKSSRIAGAVIGYLITTGILLWGISLYGEGNQIALFGIPLSEPVFFIACLVWYGFDTRDFLAARKVTSELEEVLKSPLVQDEHVVSFYKTTLNAWANGKLSRLGKGFEKDGGMEQKDFIKKYPPTEGSALRVFFEKFQPLEGEYLIGLGNLGTTINSGWFVLTNLRLIQRDGRNNEFKEVILAEVASYTMKGGNMKTMVFKMKSGEDITFEKVLMYPSDKFLSKDFSSSGIAQSMGIEKVADAVVLPPKRFILTIHLLSIFLPAGIVAMIITLTGSGNNPLFELFVGTLLFGVWFFLYYLLAGGMEWKTAKLSIWRLILFWLLSDFVLGLVLWVIWYLIRYITAKIYKIPMAIARGHLLRRRSVY